MQQFTHPTNPLGYFSSAECGRIALAKTFPELALIALDVLGRMPGDVGFVCGPITTGGLGSFEKNLARFARTIDLLAARGYNVFTQVIFQEALLRLYSDKSYCKGDIHLLEEFYTPVFSSDRVTTQCFIPGSESSHGATWEKNLGQSLGLAQLHFHDNYESRQVYESLFQEQLKHP